MWVWGPFGDASGELCTKKPHPCSVEQWDINTQGEVRPKESKPSWRTEAETSPPSSTVSTTFSGYLGPYYSHSPYHPPSPPLTPVTLASVTKHTHAHTQATITSGPLHKLALHLRIGPSVCLPTSATEKLPLQNYLPNPALFFSM